MMFQINQLLSLFQFHKAEILMFLDNNTSLGVGECYYKIEEEHPFENESLSTTTDSSSCSDTDNQTHDRKEPPFWIFAILGGCGASPGDSSGSGHIKGLARYIMIAIRFLNKLFSDEHGLIEPVLSLCDHLSSIVYYYFGSIIPTIVLYFVIKYYKFINNKVYRVELKYKAPSHQVYLSIFDICNKERAIKTLNNFLLMTGSRPLIELPAPKVEYSNYTKYSIPSFDRLNILKERLGLVSVNSLNLVMDTVHHTFAGVGLKSVLPSDIYSAIVVRTVTKAYSRLHRREHYGLFNTLVIGGIGVVVWYKLMNYYPMVAEPIDYFNNPTAVVEGYKRVTFWMTEDVHQIVRHTFTHESPFNEMGGVLKKMGLEIPLAQRAKTLGDGGVYMGLGIMIATFITTDVLVPLTTNVVIPQLVQA